MRKINVRIFNLQIKNEFIFINYEESTTEGLSEEKKCSAAENGQRSYHRFHVLLIHNELLGEIGQKIQVKQRSVFQTLYPQKGRLFLTVQPNRVTLITTEKIVITDPCSK